jgi:TolB-like protein/DNA-binding winged helix-turn-helix (wHTH) protein/Flp pilus assembly protein TadD
VGSSPAGTQESIKFGKDFEVDLRAFELRRFGRPLKLERIPLQVLLILIEQKGQLVTRDEIAEKIWGKDVFLDTDNSINGAVRKIRQVLGDDSQQPRYVETLTGRGYRFIAPVSGEEPSSSQGRHPLQAREPEREPAQVHRDSQEIVDRAAEAPAAGAIPAAAKGRRFGFLIVLVSCGAIGFATWFGWRHFYGERATQSVRSIAVLPLQNLSGDPAQEYFSDGMTEELITELARIESLRVISHTSVMNYKGTKKLLPEIARELGVDAILEGSVIRENNNVRVTVQLLDGPADRHLWGEEYERPLNGVLNLQRDVARAIAQEVRARLSATQQSPVHIAHAVNPAAYDDYLKGRFYFDNGFSNPDSMKKGRQYFEQSIQADPNFAQAYAGLANTYIYSAFAGVLNRDWAYRSAKNALAKAMELDDSVGEAHDTLGTLKEAFEGDLEGADREYSRAIALAPSYSCAHEDRASLLASLGRREEALAELAKIDQLDFGIGSASTEVGVYYTLRDYPNLIDASKRMLLFDSNNSYAHRLLGVGFEGTGKLQEAVSEYQKAVDLSGGDPYSVVPLAHAWSAVGKKAEAQKVLRDLERKLSAAGGTSTYLMATIYAGLGEKDKAFDYLNRAFHERSFELSGGLKADPAIDNLRNDPRFQELARGAGLPQ